MLTSTAPIIADEIDILSPCRIVKIRIGRGDKKDKNTPTKGKYMLERDKIKNRALNIAPSVIFRVENFCIIIFYYNALHMQGIII